MNRTMITATNTLTQLQKQMDIISHNMANVQTNGYKRRETNFTDLLVQQFNNQRVDQNEIGRLTPNGIRQGTGAKLAQAQIVMAQGSIKSTERPLDTAFTQEGQFYKVLVQDENGNSAIRYTRDGAFYVTPVSENEVQLVTGDGYAVLDEDNNPIFIEGEVKDFKISKNGIFTAEKVGGENQNVNLAVISVLKPQFLEQVGGNLLGLPNNFLELGVTEADIYSDLNGELRELVSIQQGALEQSNVDISKEMTDLINTQRSYQFQSKSISIADQMMGLINGIR